MKRTMSAVVCGILASLCAVLLSAKHAAEPGNSKHVEAAVPISDETLANATGGTKYLCCWRYSSNQCTAIPPAVEVAQCVVDEVTLGCTQECVDKIVGWKAQHGPSGHDQCDRRSSDSNATCNIPQVGWCVEWEAYTCQTVWGGGCVGTLSGILDWTGQRLTCDYVSGSGIKSTICPE